MRKMLILVGMLLISFVLVACGDDVVKATPPTFIGLRIDGTTPVVDGELVPYYKGKNDIILVEVNLKNPDDLLITSIVIDGYNYFASRFLETSTNTVIYFEMSAGTTLGIKTLSLDKIIYKSGAISETVLVSNDNEFIKYVYKNIPTVERESYTVTQDTIVVSFDILDIDTVIVTDTLIAELYSGETLVSSKILSLGQSEVVFSLLLSNKNYEIKVKANFDLDDNQNLKTEVVLYSGPFSTLANSIPSATIINAVVTSNSIIFDVVYNDEDEVTRPNGISIGVYKDEVFLYAIGLESSTTGVSVAGLLNDNEYTLKVLSDYDLFNGYSIITDAILATHTFMTLPKMVPEPTITNLSIEENRILFEFDIYDPDGIIDQSTLKVVLYINGDWKETIAVDEYVADFQVYNLFANTNFVIEIVASYNLNDGLDWVDNQVIFRLEDNTDENEAPTVYVTELIVTQGYVTINLEVSDVDETLNGALTAILYEVYTIDDVDFEFEVGRIQFNDDITEIVFFHLTSHLKGYRVDIEANYDLIDGTGRKENINLFRSILISSERKAPVAELNDVVFTTETISVNINLMDSDLTIVADSMIVYLLFNGEVVLDSEQNLVVGLNPIVFSGLLSDNEYEVVVVVDYTYDLIDESVDLLDQELIHNTVFTLEKEVATAEILEVFGDTESIEFKVIVIDEFYTVDDMSLKAYLYLDDDYQDKSYDLNLGNNFGVIFTGLLSDKQYEIRIITDYDLNNGSDLFEDVELTNYFVYTQRKDTPKYQNFNISSTQDEISFDIEIVDDDNVITSGLIAKLYIGEDDTGIFIDLNVGINSGFIFDVVYSNERYNIRVIADYDYNDESLIETETSIAVGYVNTLINTMITALITDVDATKTTITFDVFVVDDNTVSTANLQAVLYDDLDVPVVGVSPETVVVGENTIVFSSLLSDINYTVKIETDYDLELNGVDPVFAGVLSSVDTTTLSLDHPTATITLDSSEVNNTRIEFDVNVVDNDSTITQELRALLYKDGVYEGRFITLTVGDNPNEFFDALEFGIEYEIIIVTDYYLYDNNPHYNNIILDIRTESTISMISIIEISEDKKLISFILDITDIFDILVPVGEVTGVEVRLFDENDIQVGDVYFVSEPTDFDLLNLWSDYDYYIVAKANYDIGAGTENGTVFVYEFHTLPLDIPDIQISLDHVVLDLGFDIDFEITGIIDTDFVIQGDFEAVLFINGVETETLPVIADGTYSFAGYDGTNGSDYVIIVRATVNLNDANGDYSEFEFDVKSWIYADKILNP